MNTIQRSGSIRRLVRRFILRMPEKKHFVSGDRACLRMMQNARRRRRRPDPEEESILACARIDLMREITSGFWERAGNTAA